MRIVQSVEVIRIVRSVEESVHVVFKEWKRYLLFVYAIYS